MLQSFFAGLLSVIMLILSWFGIGPRQYWNLKYGDKPQQKVDLYLPRENKECGLLLYIHGGGWTDGDKKEGRDLCKNVAENGAAAATMNYRMLNGKGANDYNDMLNDIDSAVKAIVKKAAQKKVTITSVAVMGASAGGHLSLLYAYTRYNSSSAPLPIAFVASMTGPTDFTDPELYAKTEYWVPPLIAGLIGESGSITAENVATHIDKLRAASPITYVSADLPPSLLAYGVTDTIVPISNGDDLAQALETAGADYQYFRFEHSGHDLSNAADAQMANDFYSALWSLAAATLL